ncbi:hypothetical protein DRJ19_03460 [Candidatus Woesearchaeota archaeon]|nr:MAG: hypothetical protein DRJ19_03460 [Candidatus Woesearchaeota archaeon]
MKKGLILILLIAVIAVVPVALSQETVTITVTVADETGAPVSNAVVTVYDNTGTKVTEGTTDTAGNVTLTIPNATVTFWIKLATGKYIVYTRSDWVNVTAITINASTMNYVTITANTTEITATIVPLLNNKTEVKISLNATIYGLESINVTFLGSKVKYPFIEERLVEINVNGTIYTDTNTVTVDLATGDYTVIAGYKQFYTFTWTWQTFVLIAFIVTVLVLVSFAFVKIGKSALTVKPRKYLKIGK